MKLGKVIKELRKERGMSQSQLLEKINIKTMKHLSYVENDKSVVTPQLLESLAEAFEVPEQAICIRALKYEEDSVKKYPFLKDWENIFEEFFRQSVFQRKELFCAKVKKSKGE